NPFFVILAGCCSLSDDRLEAITDPHSQQILVAQEVKCEVERYIVLKHFYGNRRGKFPQNPYFTGQKVWFYIIVSFYHFGRSATVYAPFPRFFLSNSRTTVRSTE